MTTTTTNSCLSHHDEADLPGRFPTPPTDHTDWRGWIDYGLAWSTVPYRATGWSAPSAAVTRTTFPLRFTAYQEDTPGRRWKALYDATWAAYSSWYASEGLSHRPSLAECRQQLVKHMPELVPVWERLVKLSGNDTVAARLLSMWRMPSFACGCSQAVIAGSDPLLVRNYDYDLNLFEGVIASTNWSGHRKVIGTSDLLWGLLDGMNEDGLVASLTFGGRSDVGDGFGIPLVIRYLLETCADVDAAIAALRRLPVSQSYNVTLADTSGAHATVFVTPGDPIAVSDLTVATNHRLDVVERPEHAARLGSLPRQQHLNQLLDEDTPRHLLVDAFLEQPLRADQYTAGFGTLYTAAYRPAAGSVTYRWPGETWVRTFDDADDHVEVALVGR
ncbi:MAG: C45 family autoproteolytic acyltransferase/hydrolase [Humibacillus sp.]|nr:C45 family autoproteolytic acyltransferase/hydrolase [Humibacillus sp.]MDN5776573.1 C45 family autoproteolytic acyltransferase/hydrolase [Humibacillus sp.]